MSRVIGNALARVSAFGPRGAAPSEARALHEELAQEAGPVLDEATAYWNRTRPDAKE